MFLFFPFRWQEKLAAGEGPWFPLVPSVPVSAGKHRRLQTAGAPARGLACPRLQSLAVDCAIGAFFVCPLAAEFCRGVIGLLASVLPGNSFSEEAELV